MPSALRATWIGAVLLALAAGAAGQEETSGPKGRRYAETPEELGELLWQRDRELMHSQEPLELGGLPAAKETYLAETPALARGIRASSQVDTAELYRRRLAMYEHDATFHSPVPPAQPAPPPASSARNASPPPADPPSALGPDAGLTVAVVLLAALLAWRALSES